MKSAMGIVLMLILTGCSGRSSGAIRSGSASPLLRPAAVPAGTPAIPEAGKAPAGPLALTEAYRLAAARSETLALREEELARLESQFGEIVGSALPRVTVNGSYQRQDTTGVGRSGGSAGSGTLLAERPDFRLHLRQPMFAGLREFYAARQVNALTSGKGHELAYARRLLWIDVAQAFYGVFQTERERDTMKDLLRLAEERLEELQARQRLGMSRRSEVLAQEAEAASGRARLEAAEGQVRVAREVLRFFVGDEAGRSLRDATGEPTEPAAAQALVDRATGRREDLLQALDEIRGAEQGIGVARAGYFPTVAFEANQYWKRTGTSEPIDWDVLLSLEFPVFDGWVTRSRMRSAESLLRSARWKHAGLSREIDLRVREVHADMLARLREYAALGTAVSSAQEQYELVEAEYRRGISTNLEVLAAFTMLQQARLEHDRVRWHLRVSDVELKVQCGEDPGVTP